MYQTELPKHSTSTFTIEALMHTLETMRDETVRCVKDSSSEKARTAWFYSQIGAYDLAFQMGWITHEELRAFYDELHQLTGI